MNKIFLISLAMLLGVSYAAIDSSDLILDDSLKAQGFGASTRRMVDNVLQIQQVRTGDYESQYETRDFPNFWAKAYYRLKLYVDLAQDDDNFGLHNVGFTNSWNYGDAKYSTRKVLKQTRNTSDTVEDL